LNPGRSFPSSIALTNSKQLNISGSTNPNALQSGGFPAAAIRKARYATTIPIIDSIVSRIVQLF
jgi:hypothetical protein